MNVTLSGDGGETLLAHHDMIAEDDIFRHPIPDTPGGPVTLSVSFRTFYGEGIGFDMPVLTYDSMEALQRDGVLLYFQEHDDVYLNVIAGGYHASYKKGPETDRWALMDMPNRVYAND